MNKSKYIKKEFNVSDEVLAFVEKAEERVLPYFKKVEEKAEINQLRVMKAFSDNQVSEAHLQGTTGYGHDDLGRDTLDKIYAQLFECEDALVRHNFISGTHTISTALFGVLRPGDLLVGITGKPYDTLEEVIGISGDEGKGSLKDFGIRYMQVDLMENGEPDFGKIKEVLTENKVKAVEIQRSKGYGQRPTYSAEKIGEITDLVKSVSKDTIVIVDNCYGEFVDCKEPTAYGADLAMGSLIKNPGGGLAKTGGYIAGRSDLVELCANRLNSVGIGRDEGASHNCNRDMYQGLFMAPHTVSQAIKTAVLCASVYESLGFKTEPGYAEERHDIIQAITFNKEELLIAFCEGVQKGAPVDSFVVPQPWEMPGYADKVIMAAGAFVQGASIEFSADGPIKPPYTAYMQGGLTYESAKLGIIMSVQNMQNKGLIKL